jgi:hypothetical protein
VFLGGAWLRPALTSSIILAVVAMVVLQRLQSQLAL